MDFRAYEAAPGVSVIVLPDAPVYTHVAVSNDFLRASGMQRQEVMGKGHFEVFPKSSDSANFSNDQDLKASFEWVVQHKQPHEIPVLRYDIPDGAGSFNKRYWKINNVPLLSDTGDVTYIIHTALDITNTIVAEQKVALSKEIEKLYNFFINAPVVIGIVRGNDYVIELANEELLEVWGRTADVIGKPLLEAIPELEAQGIKALLDRVCATGEPFYAYEYPVMLNRNGKEEVLYFDFVYKPAYDTDENNKYYAVVCIGHNVTEHVRTRQKFKNVVQQAPDPILILKGEDMVLEVANEALFKIWKVDHTSIGKTFLEILPEMEGQGFLELLQQVYHTGETFKGYETPAVFEEADGGTRTVYFDFTYQPFREADGSISGVLVVATDVTGQVLAKRQVVKSQQELRLSIERFELVSKATEDAIWDWNILTNELVWNEAVYTLFGYKPEDVDNVDLWWFEHLHPEERDSVTRSVYEVIDGGGSLWTSEYRFLCSNGTYRIVHDRGIVQRDDNGKAIRVIGSMQDITERKQYELSLKESQQKWQQLANTIPSLVWTADSDGQVNFLNEYWYRYTGLTEEQSIGYEWAKVVHPDELETCLATWSNARKEKGFYEIEVRFRSKAGEYRWFVSRGVPIHNDEGDVVAWYGTSTDIHEQKRLSENLETLVAERTAELERSNVNLEAFAYAASHDLKEPVRKIHLFSDKLKSRLNDKLEAEDVRLFERIQYTSKRMNTLIDDLLAYSQASFGDLDTETIDLNKKVQSVLEDLELEVQEKGAKVEVESLPTVKGYPRQFQQLFQNLISNALKYSKPGTPPEILLSCRPVIAGDVKSNLPPDEACKPYHLIYVKDNGIGFAQKDAERIFNVFTRLHVTQDYKGTGVGLSIVQKVVENHGGYIWAESEPGEGATFNILMPVNC